MARWSPRCNVCVKERTKPVVRIRRRRRDESVKCLETYTVGTRSNVTQTIDFIAAANAVLRSWFWTKSRRAQHFAGERLVSRTVVTAPRRVFQPVRKASKIVARIT